MKGKEAMEIYIKLPDGELPGKADKICLLDLDLYGSKWAARL